MAKRLAITIAGAVSLGSYEAGVLYEVVEALRQHNEDPRTSADEKIEIDVLTGASAGGMTATIAAQKLLFDAESLRDAVHNAFRQPWVEDINLLDLLKYDKDEKEFASLFSSNLIKRIADKHLLARYSADVPKRQPHPAAADEISLGLALSNLNGVDHERHLDHYGTFTYTRHQDEFFTELSAKDDIRERWEPIEKAALSLWCFPVCLSPRGVAQDERGLQRVPLFRQIPRSRKCSACLHGWRHVSERTTRSGQTSCGPKGWTARGADPVLSLRRTGRKEQQLG